MKCSFCNNSKLKEKIKKKSSITNKIVSYYKCHKCGSLHQIPLPKTEEILEYYESYFKIKKKMNPGYLEKSRREIFFNERELTLNEIKFKNEWFLKSKNVEIGCANGNFLEYMKKKGAEEIVGIDISKTLTNEIKNRNIKLIIGDLSMVEKNSIDNLFLFNVLEHFDDIEKVMSTIKSRLKNNGKIIIEVPISGMISNNFSSKWRFLMPDEHLHIPSLKGLKTFLKNNGFKIIGKTRFGSGNTSGSIPVFIKKILDFLAKKLFFGDRGTFLAIYNKDIF